MFKKKLTAILTAVLILGGSIPAFAQPKYVYLKSQTCDEVIYINYEDYVKSYASKNENFIKIMNDYNITGISVETSKGKHIIDFGGYVDDYKKNNVTNLDDYSDKKDYKEAALPEKVKELYKDGSISKKETDLPDKNQDKIEIAEFKKITISKGTKLPEKINALMTNGTLKEFQVKWLDTIDTNVVGNKTVNIEVDGKPYTVSVEITDNATLPEDLKKYYEKAEGKTGLELKKALHDTIKGHNKLSYAQVWDGLRDTDEDPNNPNNVILLYSGVSSPKDNNGGNVTQWNREHVWAKSRGHFGTSAGPGTDLHQLRPANVRVNSLRGHLDFDNGGSPVDGAPKCKRTPTTWEPRDEVKGDVARILFYMAVRYEGDAPGEPDLEIIDKITPNNKNGEIGKLSTLLQWHIQDPVDETEIRRNNIIYNKYQHNRNPFIDNPNWVESIWGQAQSELDLAS